MESISDISEMEDIGLVWLEELKECWG